MFRQQRRESGKKVSILTNEMKKICLAELKRKLINKKPWMTDNILEVTEERRVTKGTNKYK